MWINAVCLYAIENCLDCVQRLAIMNETAINICV